MHLRLLLLLAFALGASPAQAAVTTRGALPDEGPRAGWLDRFAEARQGPETVERASQTFKVGAGASLDLTGIAGDVRVTGGGGTDIKVDATKRVRHRDPEQARRLLAELRVDMSYVNGRVEVRSVYPRRGGERDQSAAVDYVVSVPLGTAVAVRNISGGVTLTNVTGDVRLETISGNVSVTGAPSLVLAKTVSGNVTAQDVGGSTTLTLATISGSVTATGLRVRALECGSVSGDVRLAGAQVERVEAKSVSGNIEFDAPLTRGGRYAFTSHSGSVRLVIPGASGFELDANTFSGSVRSDLPVTIRPDGRDDGGRRGGNTRIIRGSYGDGGAYLAVRSFSGSVVIVKK